MKQVVGVDIVQVSRFEKWKRWSDVQLKRVFSTEEISYAKSNQLFCAQRFAVRFAAKEAFFKAFCQLYPEKKINLLQSMAAVSVAKEMYGKPYLLIDYTQLFIDPLKSTVSLSHSNCCAIAVVQLSNSNCYCP